MKKLFLLLILGLAGTNLAMAQFPIPAYNAKADNRTTFTEQPLNFKTNSKTDSKRILHVKRPNCKTSGDSVLFYASTLDGNTILGPYYVSPGQTISIDIDDRSWGIIVYTEHEIVLDVWITNEGLPGGGDQ